MQILANATFPGPKSHIRQGPSVVKSHKKKYFLTLSNQEQMKDTMEHQNGHGNNIVNDEGNADVTQ